MRTLPSPGMRVFCAVTVLLCTALASAVAADDSNLRKADQLFRSGKQLLAEEDFEHACPQLAQSFQLDPASGTLLALALCHERQGKLASALRDYNEVIARSKHEARPDRENAARERAAALQPRLSTLTVKTEHIGDPSGLEVRINGKPIERERLGEAMAVDGGTQVIDVSAPGKEPWHGEVRIAKSVDAKTILIPVLEDAPGARVTAAPAVPAARAAATVAAPSTAPPEAAESRAAHASAAPPLDHEPAGLSAVQWVGIGAIATGVVGLGVGTIFAANAISRNRDSSKGCIGDVCSAGARQERLDARSAGNAATIAFIAGGALAVTGVSMYLLGERSTSSAMSESAYVMAAPWAGPRELGAFVRGSL